MDLKLKGTETERNLLKAFAGESQARNRYTIFSTVAQKEGYEQIAEIFIETANQELEHAKRFFKFMQGGMVTIEADYPAGRIGTTAENLLEAAEGEKLEWSTLYPTFEITAMEEGFKQIATAFKMIAKVEDFHEMRYRTLLLRLEDGTLFNREEPIIWQCRNCGFVFDGNVPPQHCPACLHTRGYFEPMRHNY